MSRLSLFPFICFDFDGVIKDSVSVKGDIFRYLFRSFPLDLREKVFAHHIANGGVNRQAKITQYLQWAYPEKPISELPVSSYLDEFSSLSVDRVVNSQWISGMPFILEKLSSSSKLFLASATPHAEILKIVNLLQINSFFETVWGHPHSKSSVLLSIKNKYKCSKSSLILVGDSEQDYLAAQSSDTSFFMKTSNNTFIY